MKTAVLVALAFLSLGGVAFADPPACTTTQPRSCANWSDYYETGTSCVYTMCQTQPTYVKGYGLVSKQESFRICSYSDGTQCKETQTKNVVEGCGC